MDAQFLAAEVPVHWSLMKIRSNLENAAAMAFFFLLRGGQGRGQAIHSDNKYRCCTNTHHQIEVEPTLPVKILLEAVTKSASFRN